MIIPQDRWRKMSEDARKLHLRNFHQMSVIEDVLQEPCTALPTFADCMQKFVSSSLCGTLLYAMAAEIDTLRVL